MDPVLLKGHCELGLSEVNDVFSHCGRHVERLRHVSSIVNAKHKEAMMINQSK